jgi:hypothetical protein
MAHTVRVHDLYLGEIAFFELNNEFGEVRKEKGGLRLLSDCDGDPTTERFIDESELEEAEIRITRPTRLGTVLRALTNLTT